jgi:hypothetical protein
MIRSGWGNGGALLGACLDLPGCLILLANGLRFQSSEAVSGSWLASVLTGRSGGAVLKHFLQCTLLSARMTWLLDAQLLCFQP